MKRRPRTRASCTRTTIWSRSCSCAAGESRYFVGGLPYQARRGDLFVFNSRVVHDEPSGPDRPVATSSLALGGLQVPGLRENALIPEDALPVCRLTEPQTVRLERLYDVLYDELTAGNDDGAHHLLMAILTLVQQFRAAAADGYAANDNVFAQRIKDYIDRHFAEEFSLQKMADALHVSPYYLAHVCKESTGYSPLQYVLRPPHRRGADPAHHHRPAGHAHRRPGGLRQPQPFQRPVRQGGRHGPAHLPARIRIPQIGARGKAQESGSSPLRARASPRGAGCRRLACRAAALRRRNPLRRAALRAKPAFLQRFLLLCIAQPPSSGRSAPAGFLLHKSQECGGFFRAPAVQ